MACSTGRELARLQNAHSIRSAPSPTTESWSFKTAGTSRTSPSWVLLSAATASSSTKKTGKLFTLGSAFPAQRDLDLYDRGFQFDCYDLVILDVANAQATLDALLKLNLTRVDPTYEHGTVWRIPRQLTRAELAERISHLPCVFGEVALYARAEVLDRARVTNHFRFELLEFRRPQD